MKLVYLGLIIWAGTFFLGCAKKISHPVPSPSPWIHLYSINGNHEILEMHKGEELVMIFWTTKCSHSVSKLLDLNSVASRNSKAKYFAVNLDDLDDKEQVKHLISKTPHLKHYFSGNGNFDAAWVALRGLAVPAIVYFDENLIIKKVE